MTNDIEKQILEIQTNAEAGIKRVSDFGGFKEFQQNFLGKKSVLTELSKGLKDVPAEQKKEVGKKVGNLRSDLENLFTEKSTEIEKIALAEKLEGEWIDVSKTMPQKNGAIHPLNQVQRDVENIFTSMGFEIADGPHLETEWNNFDALDIPANHPARDMQDTFWVKKDSNNPHENLVLRTQTSDVQIRMMKEFGAPLRLISPGRVFRNEDVDATHDAVFYQVEGLLIDKNISLAHLKGTITTMLSELFGKEVILMDI